MDYRKYTWASSISSIIERTEKNLERAHSSICNSGEDFRNSLVVIPSPSMDSFHHNKKSFPFENEEPADFTQFKTFVMEKLQTQQQEIKKLHIKCDLLEKSESAGSDFREDFNSALSYVEKRMINEIKRVEFNQKGCVTHDMLKETENYLRNDHIDYINRLEMDFRELRAEFDKVPVLILKETEEQVKSASKKFLTIADIKKIKESVVKENESLFNEVKGNCQEIDRKYSQCLNKLQEDVLKHQGQVERAFKAIKETTANTEARLLQKIQNNEESLSKAVKKSQSSMEKYFQESKESSTLEEIKEEITELARKLGKLPNFADFARKNEITNLVSLLPDLSSFNSFVSKAEFQKTLMSKPDFSDLSNFLVKSEFEAIFNLHSNSFEVFKSSVLSKSDLHKLKSQMAPQSPSKETFEQLSTINIKLQESEKSNEILINKLVQLEQRVSLLEESDFGSESIPITPKKIKHLEPVNSLLSDFGSKETESTALLLSLKKKSSEIPIDEFIHKLAEEFIDSELTKGVNILYSYKAPSKKHNIPRLNFPSIPSESPNESFDELNNAVILNTGTNQSESPIDFSSI